MLLSAILVLTDTASAAPCVFSGDRADYVQCVATQSAANEAEISVLDAAVLDLDLRLGSLEVGAVAVAGIALHPDRVGNTLGGLTNGAAYAADLGNTFTFAPVSLPDGATAETLDCTLKDEDSTGYVQIVLYRADRSDPSVFSSDVIGFVGTVPATSSPDYTRFAAAIDPFLAVVDNVGFSYFLRADLIDVTSTAASVAVQSCSVTYTR